MKLGDKVYSWDDIANKVETYSFLEGSRPNAREYRYDVIGTIVSISDDFCRIELVEEPEITVVCDMDFVFPVGTGPILELELEEMDNEH